MESFYPILEKWEPVEKLLLENKIFLNNFFGEKLFNYLVKFNNDIGSADQVLQNAQHFTRKGLPALSKELH